MKINKKTGVLELTGLVQGSAYQFNVRALDNGYPVRESSASVRINVASREQTVLMFRNSPYTSRISESELAGYTVAQVKVTLNSDKTRYELITGSLPRSDPTGMFRIDPKSGTIHLVGKLDYETISQYSLMVKAFQTDSDVKPAYTIVSVIVENANDNPPVFDSKLYNVTIPENIAKDSMILQVAAFDADDPDGTNLTYHILSQSTPAGDPMMFSLNQYTGELQTAATLDAERKSSYRLVIRVYDDARSDVRRSYDTAVIQITVLDTNDSPPTFVPGHRRFSVREDQIVGDRIASVMAEDADKDSFILYYIEKGNELGMFKIDESSGEIRLVAPLDRETKESYTLTIVAYDGVFVAKVDIEIIVTDINDNSPVCSRAFYKIAVTEGVEGSPIVARINAYDPDSKDELTYSRQGDCSSKFLVNERTSLCC